MRKLWLQSFTIILAIGLSLRLCQAQPWQPDTAEISKLEAGDFPRLGHSPDLSTYARYYAGISENGHHLIVGELLTLVGDSRTAGVHIVAGEKDFPVIFDGGCSVMHIRYDVDTSQIISLICNGRG
jgi:hypothetical protein